jgi:hypothetical protein
MSQLSAFEATGKSFSISVAAANQVTPVNLADLGLTQIPQALQLINNGNVDVWFTMGNVSTIAAAFPIAGTITTGTPQPGIRLKPGAIVVYRCNANDPTQQVSNAAGTNKGPGFYIAMIGAAAGPSIVDVTPGEGV